MTESEMLSKMVAPGTHRPGKYGSDHGFGGVIQVLVTSNCDRACFNCTQASNLQRPKWFMTPEQFEEAVRSLGFDEDSPRLNDPSGREYPGVVGVFGGNPAISPHFAEYCAILRRLVPWERRGIWCNNPLTDENAREMARTFNPAVSNLNVHMDRNADALFRKYWPAAKPFGLSQDSRHSPPWVAMKDVVKTRCEGCSGTGNNVDWACSVCGGSGEVPDHDRIRELVSTCDINQHWSAMIGVFRGQLRAWFCEVAGAQAMLHQDEPDYPDTGVKIESHDGQVVCGYEFTTWEPGDGKAVPSRWWTWPMSRFADQVRKHCHECGVPLRGYGELAQADRMAPPSEAVMDDNDMSRPLVPKEQVSATHAALYRPKRTGRRVEVVTDLVQLETGRIQKTTHYMQNASR